MMRNILFNLLLLVLVLQSTSSTSSSTSSTSIEKDDNESILIIQEAETSTPTIRTTTTSTTTATGIQVPIVQSQQQQQQQQQRLLLRRSRQLQQLQQSQQQHEQQQQQLQEQQQQQHQHEQLQQSSTFFSSSSSSSSTTVDPRSIVFKKQEQNEQQTWFMESFYHQCPIEQLLPTLYQTPSERILDIQLKQNYTQHFNGVYKRYQEQYSIYSNNIEPLNDATTTLTLQEPSSSSGENTSTLNLILWGRDHIKVQRALVMSAYTSLDNYVEAKGTRRIFYISPAYDPNEPLTLNHSIEKDIDHIIDIYPNDNDQSHHYIFFAINHYNIFAHILIDTLPYLAYLKYTMPSNVKFILPNSSKTIIETFDQEFANNHVIWIDCTSLEEGNGWCQNEMVRLHGNGSNTSSKLTVVHPHTNLRHMIYLDYLRRWINDAANSKDMSRAQQFQEQQYPYGTIIYYTRNNPTAGHGRAMNIDQERLIIQKIRDAMIYYNRREEFVIFDGTQTFIEQYQMFQNANIIIGAHGGGLANLLFTTTTQKNDCNNRIKVLEFLNNPLTPDVQDGSFSRSYYEIYTTIPWLEYHHILYHSRSTSSETFINMQDFQLAIDDIFSLDNNNEESKSTTMKGTLTQQT